MRVAKVFSGCIIKCPFWCGLIYFEILINSFSGLNEIQSKLQSLFVFLLQYIGLNLFFMFFYNNFDVQNLI